MGVYPESSYRVGRLTSLHALTREAIVRLVGGLVVFYMLILGWHGYRSVLEIVLALVLLVWVQRRSGRSVLELGPELVTLMPTHTSIPCSAVLLRRGTPWLRPEAMEYVDVIDQRTNSKLVRLYVRSWRLTDPASWELLTTGRLMQWSRSVTIRRRALARTSPSLRPTMVVRPWDHRILGLLWSVVLIRGGRALPLLMIGSISLAVTGHILQLGGFLGFDLYGAGAGLQAGPGSLAYRPWLGRRIVVPRSPDVSVEASPETPTIRRVYVIVRENGVERFRVGVRRWGLNDPDRWSALTDGVTVLSEPSSLGRVDSRHAG